MCHRRKQFWSIEYYIEKLSLECVITQSNEKAKSQNAAELDTYSATRKAICTSFNT